MVAVSSLSLGIQREEVFGLLGPDGADKSTAIQMMVGFITPFAGTSFGKRESFR